MAKTHQKRVVVIILLVAVLLSVVATWKVLTTTQSEQDAAQNLYPPVKGSPSQGGQVSLVVGEQLP